MLKAGATAFLLLSSLVACGVGDETGDDGPDPNGRQCSTSFALSGSVMNAPPVPDNVGGPVGCDLEGGSGICNEPDGIPDIQGCWPSGLWSFTASAPQALTALTDAEGACTPAPQPLAKYEVTAEYKCLPAGKDCTAAATDDTRGDWAFEIKYKTDTTIRTHIKIGSGGGGLCEGIFELFDSTGKEVWNLHPALQADGSLNGDGEFSRYATDQWSE